MGDPIGSFPVVHMTAATQVCNTSPTDVDLSYVLLEENRLQLWCEMDTGKQLMHLLSQGKRNAREMYFSLGGSHCHYQPVTVQTQPNL